MVTRAWILKEVARTTGFKVLSQGERGREEGKERKREKENKRKRWCDVLSLRLLYYFPNFPFEIGEPLIDSVPSGKPLSAKGFVLSHLAFFLVIALGKLLVYWADVYQELTIYQALF